MTISLCQIVPHGRYYWYNLTQSTTSVKLYHMEDIIGVLLYNSLIELP